MKFIFSNLSIFRQPKNNPWSYNYKTKWIYNEGLSVIVTDNDWLYFLCKNIYCETVSLSNYEDIKNNAQEINEIILLTHLCKTFWNTVWDTAKSLRRKLHFSLDRFQICASRVFPRDNLVGGYSVPPT